MATNLVSKDRQVEVTFSPIERLSVQSDSKHEIFPSKSDEERRYWPTDIDLVRLLSGDEEQAAEQDPSQSSEAEADGSPGTALDRLIARWG